MKVPRQKKLAEEVADLALIESQPLQDGRNMVMMLAPHRQVTATRPEDEEEGGIEGAVETTAEVAEGGDEVAAETSDETPATATNGEPADEAAAVETQE